MRLISVGLAPSLPLFRLVSYPILEFSLLDPLQAPVADEDGHREVDDAHHSDAVLRQRYLRAVDLLLQALQAGEETHRAHANSSSGLATRATGLTNEESALQWSPC